MCKNWKKNERLWSLRKKSLFICKLLATSNLQTVTVCCGFVADFHASSIDPVIMRTCRPSGVCLPMLCTQWLRAFLIFCCDHWSAFYCSLHFAKYGWQCKICHDCSLFSSILPVFNCMWKSSINTQWNMLSTFMTKLVITVL